MPTILIAEDHDAFRNPVGTALRARGYDVVTANDGEAALRVLRERAVDLVLLDLMMPRKGGEQVVRAMRSDPRLSRVPVIVATATTMPSVERELRPAVQDWLVKSTVSLAQIAECIRRHVPPPPASLGGVPAPKPEP